MKPRENQLEPENLLATKLGMSRETIRKAMSALMQDGIITRKHGEGNFGHPAVTNLPMRIDINSDFKRILSGLGYGVKTVRSDVTIASPSKGMLKRMPEAADAKVVAFNIVYYANESPAVYGNVELLEDCVVTLPESGEYTEPMNEFLMTHCKTPSNHTTAWLMAENAGGRAHLFDMEPAAPMLCWEEIYYNVYDEKMGYIKISFNPAIMDLSLLLKF
jgi:DNA-binding GntR family transcriptional regulator